MKAFGLALLAASTLFSNLASADVYKSFRHVPMIKEELSLILSEEGSAWRLAYLCDGGEMDEILASQALGRSVQDGVYTTYSFTNRLTSKLVIEGSSRLESAPDVTRPVNLIDKKNFGVPYKDVGFPEGSCVVMTAPGIRPDCVQLMAHPNDRTRRYIKIREYNNMGSCKTVELALMPKKR